MESWLEINRIETAADLARCLGRPSALRELTELAESWIEPESSAIPAFTTLAGVGLDLGVYHEFGCMSHGIRRAQVNELLGAVSHYFDRVILDDALGHQLRQHRNSRRSILLECAYAFGSSLLALRSAGALDLVSFTEKQHLDEDRAEETFGPAEFHALRGELVPRLLEESTIWLKRERGHGSSYILEHRGIPNRTFNILPKAVRKSRTRERQRAAADDVAQRQLWWLHRDLTTARLFDAPITLATSLQAELLHSLRTLRGGVDLSLDVRLPILRGIPPAELIRLRRDEEPAFLKFRAALRAAMRLDSTEPASGRQVQRDLIEPELANITQRLKTAESAFARKAGYGVTLGIATAACGLLLGPVALVTAGVGAAIAAAYTAESKLIDERRDAKLSDMYFVWRAMH